MIKKYKITEILHSGRKGLRNTPVSQDKYNDLTGCVCTLDIDNIKPYHGVHMELEDHPFYDWWDTSVVIEATIVKETGTLILETANTIYKLEALDYGEKT